MSPSTRAFATNHFVYVYYTATTPTIHNRISRFTANGDVAVAGSEFVHLRPRQSGQRDQPQWRSACTSGLTGSFTLPSGENGNSANAQSLNTVLGKMLRLNSDGTIPTDNPFFTHDHR